MRGRGCHDKLGLVSGSTAGAPEECSVRVTETCVSNPSRSLLCVTGGSGEGRRMCVRGDTDLESLTGPRISFSLDDAPSLLESAVSAGGVDGDALWPPLGLLHEEGQSAAYSRSIAKHLQLTRF